VDAEKVHGVTEMYKNIVLTSLVFVLMQASLATAEFLVFDQKLLSPENNANFWGYRLQIDNDRLLISNDVTVEGVGKAGSVDFYLRDTLGNWQSQQRILPPVDFSLEFGWINFGLTDLSGDNLLIGAPFADNGNSTEAGKAFLYRYDQNFNQWTQTDEFSSSNSKSAELFGKVSYDTNRIVVGASNAKFGDIGAGRIYIFEQDINTQVWTEVQQIDSPYIDNSSSFGQSVLLRNNTIFVSTSNVSETQPNGVYVYQRDQTGIFQQENILFSDDETPGSGFGYRVVEDNTSLLISAYSEDLYPERIIPQADGALYFYLKDNKNKWIRQQKLVSPISDPETGGHFAVSIARFNDVLLVNEYQSLPSTGKFEKVIHQYQLDTSTQLWQYVQTITRLDPGTMTNNMNGVAFDGTTAVVSGVQSTTGQRIDAVYLMKMVPENSIDLVISQSTSVTDINLGDTFSVDYTVTNQGSDAASAITFYSTLSNLDSADINCGLVDSVLQCGINDLAVDESQTFRVTYRANAFTEGNLQLIGTVITSLGEANSLNNAVLSQVNVTAPPAPPPSKSGGGSLFFLPVLMIFLRSRIKVRIF